MLIFLSYVLFVYLFQLINLFMTIILRSRQQSITSSINLGPSINRSKWPLIIKIIKQCFAFTRLWHKLFTVLLYIVLLHNWAWSNWLGPSSNLLVLYLTTERGIQIWHLKCACFSFWIRWLFARFIVWLPICHSVCWSLTTNWISVLTACCC